ncbi:hypothetical protein KCU74_g37, partial [Aureobasidium melanogenum]
MLSRPVMVRIMSFILSFVVTSSSRVGRVVSKRVLDMRGVGWIQGESCTQPVGDGVEPYVKVSPDGIVRATEDMTAGRGAVGTGVVVVIVNRILVAGVVVVVVGIRLRARRRVGSPARSG